MRRIISEESISYFRNWFQSRRAQSKFFPFQPNILEAELFSSQRIQGSEVEIPSCALNQEPLLYSTEFKRHSTGSLQSRHMLLVVVLLQVARQKPREIRVVLLRFLDFLFIEGLQRGLVPLDSPFHNLSCQDSIPLDWSASKTFN